MKITRKTEKKFNPITIEIVIESEEELQSLLMFTGGSTVTYEHFIDGSLKEELENEYPKSNTAIINDFLEDIWNTLDNSRDD